MKHIRKFREKKIIPSLELTSLHQMATLELRHLFTSSTTSTLMSTCKLSVRWGMCSRTMMRELEQHTLIHQLNTYNQYCLEFILDYHVIFVHSASEMAKLIIAYVGSKCSLFV